MPLVESGATFGQLDSRLDVAFIRSIFAGIGVDRPFEGFDVDTA